METKLTTTTETPKLSLKGTIKVDKDVEREIPLPYFFKRRYGGYSMVTVDKKVIYVTFHKDLLATINVTEEVSKYEIEEINEGKEATADEFFYALNQANEKISKQIKKIIL